MGPVRVGVVGFGLRASLARAVVDSGLGEVTAVLDPSERGRADARRALGADLPIAESLDALLASGVEAIMVLSPDDTHRDVAVAALRAGVPVFCEKPLATTIGGCDDVLRTAYETRTRLYVGHNMRHMPVVRQLRDVITSGRIGSLRTIKGAATSSATATPARTSEAARRARRALRPDRHRRPPGAPRVEVIRLTDCRPRSPGRPGSRQRWPDRKACTGVGNRRPDRRSSSVHPLFPSGSDAGPAATASRDAVAEVNVGRIGVMRLLTVVRLCDDYMCRARKSLDDRCWPEAAR